MLGEHRNLRIMLEVQFLGDQYRPCSWPQEPIIKGLCYSFLPINVPII